MKQLRWVWILGIAAVLLVGIFIVVDRRSKVKEEQAQIGGPKQLFSFDGDDIVRLTIDNEEGSFDFEWDDEKLTWKLVSEEQFEINAYAVAAITNYFSNLASEKTIAFDCKDTAAYGFDDPVTIRVYTTQTGENDPYVLYVGDNTPTYDAYYAMVGGSDDVFTIGYTDGSIFCAAKDTLKNLYIFDTTASMIDYIKIEREGKVTMEMQRDTQAYVWNLLQPAELSLMNSEMDILCDNITRVTVTGFVEENPDDLAKYGLDKPHTKLWIKGKINQIPKSREIWFGSPVSEHEEETQLYGYYVEEKQVFTIKQAEISFTEKSVNKYISPYCVEFTTEEVKAVEINMGEIYDLHATLSGDPETGHSMFNETDITARDDETLSNQYSTLRRAIFALQYTDLDLDAKPDPEQEPAMQIIYTMQDDTLTTLDFIEKEKNDYYLICNGEYTGMTVRLKSFSAVGGVIESYEAFTQNLK